MGWTVVERKAWYRGGGGGLKRLFYKAYPTTQQGSPEAEAMGRTVLSSQFVAGLRADIKARVAGVEGDFEARFE